MRKAVVFIWFVCFILINSAAAQNDPSKKIPAGIKKMCITFDNLPAERNYDEAERYRINEEILNTLKNRQVPAAGFVIGDNISGDWKILVDWLEAGNAIGFMTYSGQDIENVPLSMFMTDIAKGKETIEDILKNYKQKDRYFRYPYLHYGSKPEVRNRVEGLLKEQKITIAHVSIVVEDFVYNLSLEKIGNTSDTTKINQLRSEYLDHILERLAHAETLANDIVNRPIRHIIQFRANRLNALFLDDILVTLADKGYSFISLQDALKDKVYKIYDNYYEPRGVSYLERLLESE